MNNEQYNKNCINGVMCNVCSCAHHEAGNKCSAANISVANENAAKQADTFCSTYKPQNGCCG